MERAVIIAEADKKNEIIVKATANSLFLYKANFSRDGLTDILKLSGPSRLSLDCVDVYLSFLWAFAKSKYPDFEPFEKWIESYGLTKTELAVQIIPQIAEILGAFARASVKAKRLPVASKGKEDNAPTTEMILRRAVERGLSATDFESMTLGMIIDYLVQCQNEDIDAQKKRGKGQTRSATQADVDAF